jgi:glyoxylase-like metal-dependent hydrolase (beta-lactamase superfamily II)
MEIHESSIQPIDRGLYRVLIPLPGNPLRTLNSYVIKGSERNLVIDTGFNRKECRECMKSALESLNVDLSQTDFFITHLHADHYGLVSELVRDGSTVHFNEPESRWFESGTRWDESFRFAELQGFPQHELRAALENHPGYRYRSQWHHLNLRIIRQGDELEYGGYRLLVIDTPGHTMGHQCLYEPSRKILFSGDHVLVDITPNLQLWSQEGDPLGDYLHSLKKVYEMDVKIVLPGHRRLFEDLKGRIMELQTHHSRRCDEIMEILRIHGPLNAFDIASRMSWDLKYRHWDEFPVSQKWFATGEAIAHLQHLLLQGEVKRHSGADGVFYYLSPS